MECHFTAFSNILYQYLVMSLQGSNATLVVKWADTEKERQARKVQKAQSQASNFLRADLDPQHSIVGAPLTGFVSPYNGLGYQVIFYLHCSIIFIAQMNTTAKIPR